MKIIQFNWKILTIPLVLICLAGISYFAPTQTDQVKLTSSYPATVCPAIGNKVSSIAALVNSKINRRLIDGKSKRLNAGKSSVIPLLNNAVLVEGNSGTAVTFANNSWKAVVPCSISNGEQWFAGGSGALTSKSFLYITNSGFSESTVDIEIFTPNGPAEPKSVVIAQDSTKKITRRQFEINEWAYNNKLETLFLLQLLFISVLILVLFLFLSKSGYISNVFAGGLCVILFLVLGYVMKQTKPML